MDRGQAIRIVAEKQLRALSLEERGEQLWTMTVEGWDEDPRWASLPADLRREFDEEAEFEDPADRRYDPVLMIWLESELAGSANQYLTKLLRESGVDGEAVTGEEPELTPCPCCGLRSLSSRGDYEICRVCWWEDDGQDNDRADTVMGGPNYQLSLTQARVNHLREGISDPGRLDLRAFQEPPEKYRVGRTFMLSEDGASIVEPACGWSGAAVPEPPTQLTYDDDEFPSTARKFISLGRPISFELLGKAREAAVPHIVNDRIAEQSKLAQNPKLQPLHGVLLWADVQERAVALRVRESMILVEVEGA